MEIWITGEGEIREVIGQLGVGGGDGELVGERGGGLSVSDHSLVRLSSCTDI